uniref:Integrator complex subunit 4 n=1 Tax=Acrobeloides nanus TaxID=290746 RepID=A0A914E9R2_9BILA
MKVLNDGSTAAQTDEWSTGKKLGEDVPMEREEEEVQSLIPIQACGAFVTALEDEFMAVREAAVYSLGKLAVNRPTFANATIDHLADMFNDEIAQIRLDAIHALTPLVIHGVLGQEQLNTILTGLDDAASDNRMALHELLSRSHLADAACVKQCVQILLRTLGRFPTDRESTYRCLASIGLKHAHLVQTLAVELLGVTPVFDMQEQSIEDEIYLAKLVLVLNAASKQPVICSLTPPYVKKHYRFLRCASPHLIPKIKEYEQSIISESSVCASSSMIDLKVQSLLDNAYKRMVEAHISAGISEKSALFKLILRDLEAYQTIEEEIAVPARFLHDLCNVMNLFDIVNTGIRSGDEITTIFNIIQQAHRKIGWIESQYHGVDKKILAALRECTLFLNLIQVAILIDHIPNGQKQAPKLVQEEILAVENRFKKLDSKPSDFTTKLIHWLNEKLSETVQNGSNLEEKKDFLSGHGIIAQLTGAYIPAPETLPSLRKISMKSVQVIDPNKDVQAEKIVKFVSGLPTGVELNCMLHNLTAEDLEKFRIKIEYPDETIAYYRPRSTEFITLSNRLVRVQTTVLISAQLWAEASEIQLCCGVLLSSPQGISIGANEYTKENFFVPLPDADEPTQFNKISVKIHPVNRM